MINQFHREFVSEESLQLDKSNINIKESPIFLDIPRPINRGDSLGSSPTLVKSPSQIGHSRRASTITQKVADSSKMTESTKYRDIENKVSKFMDKNQLVSKIFKFYDQHPDGPSNLAEKLIQKYRNLVFQESSLKNLYEDLANQVNLRSFK